MSIIKVGWDSFVPGDERGLSKKGKVLNVTERSRGADWLQAWLDLDSAMPSGP